MDRGGAPENQSCSQAPGSCAYLPTTQSTCLALLSNADIASVTRTTNMAAILGRADCENRIKELKADFGLAASIWQSSGNGSRVGYGDAGL